MKLKFHFVFSPLSFSPFSNKETKNPMGTIQQFIVIVDHRINNSFLFLILWKKLIN